MRALIGLLGLFAATAFIGPTSASAQLANEVLQGQRSVESVRSGERACSGLTAGDFERMGEYAMGRALQSTAVHESMNRRMAAMVTSRGERRMHVALGYRISGCVGGPASAWIASMGSMMSGRAGEYAGGMMAAGGGWRSGSDMATGSAIVIAVASALLGGALGALGMHRHRRR